MSITLGAIYPELWHDPEARVSWHSVDGICRAASPGALVGWPCAEIIGHNPFGLLHADDLPVIMAYRQRLWSGAFHHELQCSESR